MTSGSKVEETSEKWMTQLPALLIVTTSMVIDRSLRKDLIEERVRCQIWLWFCMILSLRSNPSLINNDRHIRTEDLVCETWMHLTIVSNLVSIGALAISSPLERIKKSNKGSWRFSFSAWTAMMVSSCIFSQLRYAEGTQASIAMFSLQVYVVSLCILWLIHWHKTRNKKLEQEMRNITNYAGSSSTKQSSSFVISQDMDGFDRSKWYTWKPSTTLHWISHVLESDDDIDHGVVQQLASHRIDGSLLDTLSVSQLLQLRVPYGPACHLDEAIQNELVRPFPRPREADVGNGMLGDDHNAVSFGGEMQAHHGDFLSGFDQEYNRGPPRRNFASASNRSEATGLADPNSLASEAEILSLDPDQEERIGDIMKERYGLELPRLRSEAGSTSEEAPSKAAAVNIGESSMPKKPPPQTLSKVVPVTSAMPTPPSAAPHGAIPEAILKQMPPNIQEIAKRRPELVQQLLVSRQLQVQQQQQQREDQLYTHAEEGEYEEDHDDDRDSNDETAQLIRRKKSHRQYKSTGL